ncbi:MAG: alpha/beta hydrolase [Proteobacteria bacterium]|nr:alpha/beta hydrolase [Pseudomonadota bacterium]
MTIRLTSSNGLAYAVAIPFFGAAFLGFALAGDSSWPIVNWVALAAGILMAAGATYHVVRVQRFLRQFPPPGRLLAVRGHFMHLLAEGIQGKDATIVWIPGSHDAGTQLEHLHRAILPRTRSILFDRIGCGWSSAAATPRTIENEVAELFDLLEAAAESGPFVFVGHSLGGMLAVNFAARHPQKVAGLVLLDMGCTDINVYVDHLPGKKTIGAEPWLSLVAACGLLWHALPARHPELFAGSAENRRRLGFAAQPKTHAGWISAYRAITAQPLAYVRNPGALGDLPLIAVTPLQDSEADEKMLAPFVPTLSKFELKNLVELRFAAMRAVASLSTAGELRYAPPGATHALPVEVPEFVVGVVNEMLDRVSTKAEQA